jgi:hypothetical protein
MYVLHALKSIRGTKERFLFKFYENKTRRDEEKNTFNGFEGSVKGIYEIYLLSSHNFCSVLTHTSMSRDSV